MDAKYKNVDNDPKGAWQNTSAFAPGAATHQGMVYGIQHPFTGEVLYPTVGACWRYQQDQMMEYMSGWCEYEYRLLDDAKKRAEICGVDEKSVRSGVSAIMLKEDLEISREKARKVMNRGQWPRFYFTSNGNGGIRRKTYLEDVGGKPATNFWPYSDVGHTDEAKKELMALFDGKAPFDTPKPVRLMDRMLTIATDEDSIVMDFFSGSATLADAVMQRNAEDGGKRKYILVQIPEHSQFPEYDDLCEIGKERVRRAGIKLLKEEKKCDIGFKVFKISNTNIKWSSLIADGQLDLTQIESTPDMMDFMPGTNDIDVVYEIMLRQRDVPLSEKIEKLRDIGNRTYLYADAYLICLESELTTEMIDKMAAVDPVPVKYVFRDSAFKDDIALKDETFRRLKAVIEKNTNQAKQTYTVEFI